MSTTLLIGQDSNAAIAFFKEGLLVISLSRILIGRFNLTNFIIVISLYWLAFFTRVDTILFCLS